MRALTVKQPWASLIVAGLKDVENRRWPVPNTVAQFIHGRIYVPDGDGWLVALREVHIAIHAGARHDGNEFRRALLRATVLTGEGEPDNTMQWIRGWWANRDAVGGYGALIGTVRLTGCHHARDCAVTAAEFDGTNASDVFFACTDWAEPWQLHQSDGDLYHWTFADPVELDEPIPMRGRQGLWNVPTDVLAEAPA